MTCSGLDGHGELWRVNHTLASGRGGATALRNAGLVDAGCWWVACRRFVVAKGSSGRGVMRVWVVVAKGSSGRGVMRV